MYNSSVGAIKAMKGIRYERRPARFASDGSSWPRMNSDITQTEQKLKEEKIKGQDPASQAHRQVGAKVRKTMIEISNTPPEKLPRAENIKTVASRKRKALRADERRWDREEERLNQPRHANHSLDRAKPATPSRRARAHGAVIGFVPTMGFLMKGT